MSCALDDLEVLTATAVRDGVAARREAVAEGADLLAVVGDPW